jgi:sigma-B regulation protein RsbU (phosphoserine phosphatase)
LDLCQAVRNADSVENLYRQLVTTIAELLSVPAMTLFVRDDDSGNYTCCASTAVTNSVSEDCSTPPSLPKNAFVVQRLKRLSSPLRVTLEELEVWADALKEWPGTVLEMRLRERDVLRLTRSSLLVQLWAKNDLIGVLGLAEQNQARLSPEKDDLLKHVAGQLALVLENTKLLQRLVEHERLQAQLVVAAEVQRNLLPAASPALPGIELHGFCQPASHVGGDYYDFIPLPDDSAAICIADVAGKGIAAALLMSVVQASLRSHLSNTSGRRPVSEVASELNGLICASVSMARYVTFFYAQLNAETRAFRFVNAGHNPPLLFHGSVSESSRKGCVDRLSAGGPVLGMFPGLQFDEESVAVKSGDILLAYTDGVTEAPNIHGEEFSEDRVIEVLRRCSGESARDIVDSIASEVIGWSQGTTQHDDITIVAMKVCE